MYRKIIVTVVCFFLIHNEALLGQILNADQFGKNVDSLHTFKGLFEFGANIQKQNSIIFSCNTRMDLSYWYKNSLFVLIGKFNLFRSGSEDILNGGYGHARMRLFQKNWMHPEFFAQYQADGVRGMEHRALIGGNLRFRILEFKKAKLYVGLGYMYEYENWSYAGVPATTTVLDERPLHNHYTKINTYLSYNQEIGKTVFVQFICYFQARPDYFVYLPRVSLQGVLSFKITNFLRFSVNYNLLYDAGPPVPIDHIFYGFVNKLTFVW